MPRKQTNERKCKEQEEVCLGLRDPGNEEVKEKEIQQCPLLLGTSV